MIITTFVVRPWHRRGLQVLRLRCSTSLEDHRFASVEASLLVVIGGILGIFVGVVATDGVATAADVGVSAALAELTRAWWSVPSWP